MKKNDRFILSVMYMYLAFDCDLSKYGGWAAIGYYIFYLIVICIAASIVSWYWNRESNKE